MPNVKLPRLSRSRAVSECEASQVEKGLHPSSVLKQPHQPQIPRIVVESESQPDDNNEDFSNTENTSWNKKCTSESIITFTTTYLKCLFCTPSKIWRWILSGCIIAALIRGKLRCGLFSQNSEAGGQSLKSAKFFPLRHSADIQLSIALTASLVSWYALEAEEFVYRTRTTISKSIIVGVRSSKAQEYKAEATNYERKIAKTSLPPPFGPRSFFGFMFGYK